MEERNGISLGSMTSASVKRPKRAAAQPATRTALVRQARRIYRTLMEQYPYARAELDFDSPLELLVATVLSAQTTDVGVNKVTPVLFRAYPDAAALAAANPEDMEAILKPTGFYRAKTRAVMKLSADIVERFGGEVPGTMKDLVTLPGVGRKTANVVLGNAFGVPGITVDTHFGRLARRFGWTTSTDPVEVEKEVGALFPRKDWTMLSHVVVFHGRRICHARRPACGVCPVVQWCPSFGDGETDPDKARSLLKYELKPGPDGVAPVPLLVDGGVPSAEFSTGHRGTPNVPKHSGMQGPAADASSKSSAARTEGAATGSAADTEADMVTATATAGIEKEDA